MVKQLRRYGPDEKSVNFWTFAVALTFSTIQQCIFLQDNPAYDDMPSNQSWVCKRISISEDRGHILTIWVFTVILSLKSTRVHLHVVGMLQSMSKTKTNRACPFRFILFLCLFLSLWPFHLYFIPKILPTTLRFLTLFFRSYLCLIGPFNYIYLFESLLQPRYNP